MLTFHYLNLRRRYDRDRRFRAYNLSQANLIRASHVRLPATH